jgi:hypothetical protein
MSTRTRSWLLASWPCSISTSSRLPTQEAPHSSHSAMETPIRLLCWGRSGSSPSHKTSTVIACIQSTMACSLYATQAAGRRGGHSLRVIISSLEPPHSVSPIQILAGCSARAQAPISSHRISSCTLSSCKRPPPTCRCGLCRPSRARLAMLASSTLAMPLFR